MNSKAVVFRNPEGMDIDVTRLSDGFRSILSMTFELIRQPSACYGSYELFKDMGDGSVVVKLRGGLIDEVDAHLHPTWQRKIGFWFTKHFPEIQFIVTTHSPLVCQAENRSIFRLPTPGSDQSDAGFVTGPQRERLIHGDVLDAYGTELFGKEVDLSDVAKEKLEELALLNQKVTQGELTASEQAQQIQLKQAFSAHIQSPF
ncbi:AAA family ATPase [Prosthecobacter sp. SYSU 5D2]|uniref:AAA family ATPase n=1 Tax=Prosthecobacter sp. SYSU 5D2 TaxID=3134134 RepID=UPI0031FEDA69